MNRWMKVWGVALAAVVGLVPAFAQVNHAQAFSVQQETSVTLPEGIELPDEDLLGVERGEPTSAIIVGAIWGGIGEALGVEVWHNIKGSSPTWDEVVYGAGVGALFGASGGAVVSQWQAVWPVARAAADDAARWTAKAVSAGAATAVNTVHSAVSYVHHALHTVHNTLHNYVTTPVVNAAKTVANTARSVWDWLWGR